MLFRNSLRKVLAPLLAVISGILLFTATSAISLDGSVFNSSFHSYLMDKYGIYSQLEKTADTALKNYLNEIKSDAGQNKKQKEQLLSLASQALTPEMIRLNINALVAGLMEYFSGDVRFLPDISLKPVNENTETASPEEVQQISPLSEQSLSGIDKISLSVLLMYMNRNDIISTFSEIRLFRFALSYAPLFLILLSLILLVPVLILLKARKAKAFLALAAASAGISGIAASCLMFVLSRLYLPGYLALSPLTRYIQENVLYGYISSCIQRPAISLAVFGAVLLSAAPLIWLLPGLIPYKAMHKLSSRLNVPKNLSGPARVLAKYGRALPGIVLILLLVCAFIFNVEAMKGDFHSKDLGAALERLRGADSYTAVIAARDEIVYSVEVRAVDKQSGTPIQGLHILLSGSLSDNGKIYSESGTTDESGNLRFDLQKGSFELEFDRLNFPESYNIPASYQFDIKTPGTTIITVALDKVAAEGDSSPK